MFRMHLLALAGAALTTPRAQAAKAPDELSRCVNGQDASSTMPACLAVVHDRTRTAVDRAIAYSGAGLLRFSAHDPDGAMAYFGEALALDANSDAAYAGRAVVEFATGDYDAVVADAGKAIELRPNGHPDAYLMLGTLADRQNDHEARIKYTSKAIALAPRYAPAFVIRSKGYEAEGRYDLALADLNRAVKLAPSLTTTLQQRFEIIYVGRGNTEIKAGNPQAAIGDFSAALRLNHTSASWLNRRGDAYNSTGQFSEAIADLSKAIETNPSYAVAYSNRGVSYVQTGRDDLARADFDKAVALDDTLATTYILRGQLDRRQSDTASALADFRKVVDLLPAGNMDRAYVQAAIDDMKN